VSDDAERAAADEERAMSLLEAQLRDRRLANAAAPKPTGPIDCVECGREVSVERQLAYPRTLRCVCCAAEIERAFHRGCPA
jgi:hypothetical protein